MPIIIPAKKTATVQADEETTLERLIRIVEETIKEVPRDMDGYLWAERSQAEWADLLGVSVATLRRIISKPPFVRERTQASDGSREPITLLRVGEPGEKTPRHLANQMKNLWRKRTGRVPSDQGYGCLIGCAEAWGQADAVNVFKAVMADWPAFIAGFWLAVDTGMIDMGGKTVKHMKLHHPHLPTLRLGAGVALDLYQMQQQAKGASGD